MSVSILEFDIVPNNVQLPLGVEVWVNNHQLFNTNQLIDSVHVKQEFNDEAEQQHIVKIVIKNKTQQHTQVNEQLEIISDSVIDVKNFKIDNIDIDQVIREHAVYRHSFNSNGEYTDHEFYNTLGCNGTVTFEISSPIYIWLLENM